MATRSEIRRAARHLGEIDDMLANCADIGLALIENNEQWWQDWFCRLVDSSDFERMRRQVMSSCQTSLGEVKRLRREIPSADLIRANARLHWLLDCCERCPAVNIERQQQGGEFQCLVAEQDITPDNSDFRFTLNDKGNIVEQG